MVPDHPWIPNLRQSGWSSKSEPYSVAYNMRHITYNQAEQSAEFGEANFILDGKVKIRDYR